MIERINNNPKVPDAIRKPNIAERTLEVLEQILAELKRK